MRHEKTTSNPSPALGNTNNVDTPDADRQLLFECVQLLLDKKAEQLKILDLAGFASFTDYFLICSATSTRQAQTLSDTIEAHLKSLKKPPRSIEGHTEGRWILLDCRFFVVHIFLDPIRGYYGLETLWAGAKSIPIPAEFYSPPSSREPN